MSRDVCLQIRVTRKERQILADVAEAMGLTQSAVVRQLVHNAARQLNVHPSSGHPPERPRGAAEDVSVAFS